MQWIKQTSKIKDVRYLEGLTDRQNETWLENPAQHDPSLAHIHLGHCFNLVSFGQQEPLDIVFAQYGLGPFSISFDLCKRFLQIFR